MTGKRDSTPLAGFSPPPVILGISALLIAGGAWAVSYALEKQSSFNVGTRVLPVTSLRVRSEPGQVIVSSEDVDRGYVDVTEPTRVEISNTSPQGYVLVVLPRSRMFSSVTVRGAGGDVTLGDDGGSIVERRQTGSTIPLELTFRFSLASGVASGRYPWPLQLAVQPLETP